MNITVDGGWAVVIGVAIAFIGSILGTVFALRTIAGRDREQRRVDETRAAVRRALSDITRGLTRAARVRFDGTGGSASDETTLAITDLALLIDPRDRPVEELAMATLGVVETGTAHEAARAVRVWQTTSHLWFRGEITGDHVLEAAKAEAGRHPASTTGPATE